MKNEIRCAMEYLYKKGYTAKAAMNEIHREYNTTYPSYTTAKQIFQEFKHPKETLSERKRENSPKKMERIDAIQHVLEENPNSSVRLIAFETHIPKSTVYRTLTSDLGLIFRVPVVVPHELDSKLREERIQISIELLKVLESPSIKPQHIITGDESWLLWKGRVNGR